MFYECFGFEMALQSLCENKNKSQIHTVMRVLYGKKKDRGHIKEKYKKLRDKYDQILPIMKGILNGCGLYL